MKPPQRMDKVEIRKNEEDKVIERKKKDYTESKYIRKEVENQSDYCFDF